MKPIARLMWIDDEIDLLKSHITFLQTKGYEVEPVSNGYDALEKIHESNYDLVFLDENMPGMGGLSTLTEIKKTHPNLPVVMVTKSEAESLMEEAIGKQIADFLIKPVNPNQVLLTIKKILDNTRIKTEVTSRDYLQNINRLRMDIDNASTIEDWLLLYKEIIRWDLLVSELKDSGLNQLLLDQRNEANYQFTKFIENNYTAWLKAKPENRPTLSVDILEKYVLPATQNGKPTFFFVIDCLRADQWMMFEERLNEYFTFNTSHYLSILPTATPYSRNAIFSGLYPSEIENRFPDLWTFSVESEESLNSHEAELMKDFFKRKKVTFKTEPKYFKLLTGNDAKPIESALGNLLKTDLTAIVINFVDMVSHARSDMQILKELASDEVAYRSLSTSWFEHSFLLDFLVSLSQHDVNIVVTTDHGCIRCHRGTKVHADKETSTNLRYKYGRNLNTDSNNAIVVRNPNDYRLPKYTGTTNYVIAKDDYFFLYPNNYNYFLNQFKDTFQHGGLSLEEMIVPVSVLTSKKR